MGTQRYISTSFYDDKWIQGLDPTEKFIYLYLLTNPLTNIAGVYKIENRRISFDTGIAQEEVGLIIEKFEKAGKAYRMDEYIVIPSWPKHQRYEKNKNVKEGIILNLMKIGEHYLKKLVSIDYKFDLRIVFDRLSIPYDTLSMPYTCPSKPYTCPSNYSDLDLDPDSNSNKNVGTFVPTADGSNEPPLSESQKSAIELSELLLTAHRKEFPDYLSGKNDKKTINRWAQDIEKLIRIDKKPPDKIRQVILWVKTPGNFWFSNIESGVKLREKYERLWSDMCKPSQRFSSPQNNAERSKKTL